jgi:hypothetical protein
MTTPVRIAVTGAAGQIGYALVFRLASGEVFGPQQPVILHLIEVPPVMPALDGVHMELDDCAFPTLHDVVKADSDHLEDAFEGQVYPLLDTEPDHHSLFKHGDICLQRNMYLRAPFNGYFRGMETYEREDKRVIRGRQRQTEISV